ncbi:MAG TPA: CPBP family intramembrane glutamic endopeptidase [Edaphobacter sp.]
MQQEHSKPASEPSPIFFGPFGLRAGWTLLIAAVLISVLFPTINSIIRASHIMPPHAMNSSLGPLPVFIVEIAGVLVTAIVTRIMAVIEHRDASLFGLSGKDKLKNLFLGALAGLIAISLLVVILLKAGLLAIDQQLLSGSQAIKYTILWIPPFLAIGLFEEYLFRGYLQYTLARGLSGLAKYISPRLDPQAFGFWTAAFIASFGFGAVHGSNPGESPLGLVTAGLAALLFCFSLWRTGSLWWAIGMHAAWDYGQSFVFGVADSGTMIGHRLLATHPVGTPLLSGGATGPEGSVLCLPILAALALLVHLTQPITATSYASRMPVLPSPPPEEDAAIAS